MKTATVQPGRLADRIHDRALQLLGAGLLKTEMCEQLDHLGRSDEVPAQVAELRTLLEGAALELREIMAELRLAGAAQVPTDSIARVAG